MLSVLHRGHDNLFMPSPSSQRYSSSPPPHPPTHQHQPVLHRPIALPPSVKTGQQQKADSVVVRSTEVWRPPIGRPAFGNEDKSESNQRLSMDNPSIKIKSEPGTAVSQDQRTPPWSHNPPLPRLTEPSHPGASLMPYMTSTLLAAASGTLQEPISPLFRSPLNIQPGQFLIPPNFYSPPSPYNLYASQFSPMFHRPDTPSEPYSPFMGSSPNAFLSPFHAARAFFPSNLSPLTPRTPLQSPGHQAFVFGRDAAAVDMTLKARSPPPSCKNIRPKAQAEKPIQRGRAALRPPDIRIDHSTYTQTDTTPVVNVVRGRERSPLRAKRVRMMLPSKSAKQTETNARSAEGQMSSSPKSPHFARGAVIQLASGELKRVEALRTEDFLHSAKLSANLKVDSSVVVKIAAVEGAQVAKLTFSVGEHKVQVTVDAALEHPFFVFGCGWSSCSPARTALNYGLECRQLLIGDVCISLSHANKQPVNVQPTGRANSDTLSAPPSPLTPQTGVVAQQTDLAPVVSPERVATMKRPREKNS